MRGFVFAICSDSCQRFTVTGQTAKCKVQTTTRVFECETPHHIRPYPFIQHYTDKHVKRLSWRGEIVVFTKQITIYPVFLSSPFAMYRDRKSLYNTAPFSLVNAATKLGGPLHCTALPNAPLLQTLQVCFSSYPKLIQRSLKTKKRKKKTRTHWTHNQAPRTAKQWEKTLPIMKARKIDAQNKIVA